MAYSELVKNFEKVRAYMREFYVYGFKSRNEYDAKSARSYDDERRRIESWLGDYMKFTRTVDGKNVFLSVDSRLIHSNPFYKAWKAKSFTDGDITLHFILFDILYSPKVKKTLSELTEEIDGYLCTFEAPMTFDESTIRKKLKEYAEEGIILAEKQGRRVLYSRTSDTDISALSDIIDFFSEAAPCGVVGSFLQDKLSEHRCLFNFKHHNITQAMDSEVMAMLFSAIGEGRYITVDNCSRRGERTNTLRLVPLRIYISTQNGRQHLIAYDKKSDRLKAYRLDFLSAVRTGEKCDNFGQLRELLDKAEQHTWGVNCRRDTDSTEHIEFIVRVGENEQHIIGRLEREKRCGSVEKIDDNHYRFSADVYDVTEMIPWIRTFISRITQLNFSNRTAENRFKNDIKEMYRMYGIDGGENE